MMMNKGIPLLLSRQLLLLLAVFLSSGIVVTAFIGIIVDSYYFHSNHHLIRSSFYNNHNKNGQNSHNYIMKKSQRTLKATTKTSCAWISYPRTKPLLLQQHYDVDDDAKHAVTNNENYNYENTNNDPFWDAMNQLGYTNEQQNLIVNELRSVGLISATTIQDDTAVTQFSSDVLFTIVRDFFISANSPSSADTNNNHDSIRMISKVLMEDFTIAPLIAHQTRAALVIAFNDNNVSKKMDDTTTATNNNDDTSYKKNQQQHRNSQQQSELRNDDDDDDPTNAARTKTTTATIQQPKGNRQSNITNDGNNDEDTSATASHTPTTPANLLSRQRINFKSFIVNEKAVKRKARAAASSSDNTTRSDISSSSIIDYRPTVHNNNNNIHNNNRVVVEPMMYYNDTYGLKKAFYNKNNRQQSDDDVVVYPILEKELYEFYNFMTIPSTVSQNEHPIRHTTATIYYKHARLFIGWYISMHRHQQQQQIQQLKREHAENGVLDEYNDDRSSDSKNKKNDLKEKDVDQFISLNTIIPNKRKESAIILLQYIMWLRTERQISVSYEANILRGLIKLLKFRFRNESYSDSTSPSTSTAGSAGTSSFADIPAIGELRKLHRVANVRQSISPRTSNEDKKWLSWPEYLSVVQAVKNELDALLLEYYNITSLSPNVVIAKGRKRVTKARTADSSSVTTVAYDTNNSKQVSKKSVNNKRKMERKIAALYQEYLILAIFAHIPDRQRTVRELEVGTSFIRISNNDNTFQNYNIIDKDSSSNGDSSSPVQWCIKHTPEMYKTGRTYGERPPMNLPSTLTKYIDDFWFIWRPIVLSQQQQQSSIGEYRNEHNHFFVQARTGKPLSENNVYNIVVRACYQYTGKRTNPHLLRDMIVTFVRESEAATEQQLEALALYMGHSIQIQRKSYDRRTFTKKVAPAIELMQSVNSYHLK